MDPVRFDILIKYLSANPARLAMMIPVATGRLGRRSCLLHCPDPRKRRRGKGAAAWRITAI